MRTAQDFMEALQDLDVQVEFTAGVLEFLASPEYDGSYFTREIMDNAGIPADDDTPVIVVSSAGELIDEIAGTIADKLRGSDFLAECVKEAVENFLAE